MPFQVKMSTKYANLLCRIESDCVYCIVQKKVVISLFSVLSSGNTQGAKTNTYFYGHFFFKPRPIEFGVVFIFYLILTPFYFSKNKGFLLLQLLCMSKLFVLICSFSMKIEL